MIASRSMESLADQAIVVHSSKVASLCTNNNMSNPCHRWFHTSHHCNTLMKLMFAFLVGTLSIVSQLLSMPAQLLCFGHKDNMVSIVSASYMNQACIICMYTTCVYGRRTIIYIYNYISLYIYMRIYNHIYTLLNHITYVTLHGTWNTSGAYMKHNVPRFTVPFSEWKTTEKQSRCWSSLSTAAKSFLHTRSSRFALGCPMLSNACDNSKRQEKYWLLVPTPAYKSETQSLRLQMLQKIVFQWGEC